MMSCPQRYHPSLQQHRSDRCARFGQSKLGVSTSRPEALTNDFFVNLLDTATARRPSTSNKDVYETNALVSLTYQF